MILKSIMAHQYKFDVHTLRGIVTLRGNATLPRKSFSLTSRTSKSTLWDKLNF